MSDKYCKTCEALLLSTDEVVNGECDECFFADEALGGAEQDFDELLDLDYAEEED